MVAHPSQSTILTIPYKRPNKPTYIRKLVAFVECREGRAMRPTDHPVVIEPLSEEDGGGFVASVPDLPGCMSDGDTPQEALANVCDAIAAWIEAATDMGRPIPAPSRRPVTA